MRNTYLTYHFKNLVFGTVFIAGSLNAVRFSKEAYQEQRDWKIASNAIIARDYLNKLCQTSAALSRVNAELNDESPSKKVYTAIIKRLDLLSEGIATILDSDNLVSGLIPRNKSEETSFNRTINTHHDLLRDLVTSAIQEYPVLISLAKKQIESDNQEQERMRFDLATKVDLIAAKAFGSFQEKMDQYNHTHEALHKGLQALSDALHLRTVLDQASEHLQIKSKVKYSNLHSLFCKIQAQSEDIKESAHGCSISAKTHADNIKKSRKNGVKILSAAQDADELKKQLVEIQQRTVVPRLVSKKLLCPAPLSVYEYNRERLNNGLGNFLFNQNERVDVNLGVTLKGGKPGTIRRLIFFVDQKTPIRPAFVTVVNQLRFKLEDIDILIPFTNDKSACQIAQDESGDCYVSSNSNHFYKVSGVIGLIETNNK